METFSDYPYKHGDASHAHSYLWPSLLAILKSTGESRLFEIGCGNGATARMLNSHGYEVIGVDPSTEGIAVAGHPGLHLGSAYDDLAGAYGRFGVVITLEVVEHCLHPRAFAKTAFDLLEPGGTVIVSTPFHGYWKNLALALTGRLDAHFTALWDGGHIKFWSEKTLRLLLTEAGFVNISFKRVGRFSPLAKSMFAIAERPKAAR